MHGIVFTMTGKCTHLSDKSLICQFSCQKHKIKDVFFSISLMAKNSTVLPTPVILMYFDVNKSQEKF